MSDLSAFGGGIDQPDTDDTADEQTESRYKYSAGRCRAIKKTSGERCRGSASEGDLCYYHDQDDDPVTIDSDPITLIEWTSRTLFENFDELDVDHERIRAALHGAVGLEDEPLPVYDEGIWLPARYREADAIVLRAPAITINTMDTPPRRPIFSLVDADDWIVHDDRRVRNERCLPGEDDTPTVGLKIHGEDQRWFPVDIQEADRDD